VIVEEPVPVPVPVEPEEIYPEPEEIEPEPEEIEPPESEEPEIEEEEEIETEEAETDSEEETEEAKTEEAEAEEPSAEKPKWVPRSKGAYEKYHKNIKDPLKDKEGKATWWFANETRTEITVVTEDPNDPGVTLADDERYKVAHSKSFNFMVITKDGKSKMFENVTAHNVEVYTDENGELQITTQ